MGRAALWLVRDEPTLINARPLRTAVKAYLRRSPLMICRSPLSSLTGLVLPHIGRETILQALSAAAFQQAHSQGASFLVLDSLTPDIQPLGQSGLELAKVGEAGTQMALPWSSFDEYLSSLGRNGRKHYQRTLRRARELGISITRHARVERIPEALALIRSMERRFGSPPNPWMENMLRNIEMVGGTWIAATVRDRLVGCELVLQDNGAQIVTALGLADDISYAYFALGYDDIRLAIESGMQTLYWGSGAFAVKERLGFSLFPNNFIAFVGLGAAPRLVARLARAYI
jgi:hypothetical protein